MLRLSDDELLQQARNGRETAFGELFRRHHSWATRRASSITRSDTAAVVEAAFANTFMAIRRGSGPTVNFKMYLNTALKTASMSVGRATSRAWTETPLEGFDVETDELLSPEHEELSALMRSAYDALPERQQRAIWLVDVEGLSNADASTHLGITPNAFGVLLHRSRRSLGDAYARLVIGELDLCTWASEHRSAGQALNARARMVLEWHLATCDDCRGEKATVASHAWMVPLLLTASAPSGRALRWARRGGMWFLRTTPGRVALVGSVAAVATATVVVVPPNTWGGAADQPAGTVPVVRDDDRPAAPAPVSGAADEARPSASPTTVELAPVTTAPPTTAPPTTVPPTSAPQTSAPTTLPPTTVPPTTAAPQVAAPPAPPPPQPPRPTTTTPPPPVTTLPAPAPPATEPPVEQPAPVTQPPLAPTTTAAPTTTTLAPTTTVPNCDVPGWYDRPDECP